MQKPRGVTVTTPSDCEISVTRVFDAPRRLVYDAHTRPDLVRRWAAGPTGWTMTVCEIDLRVGGAWRCVMEGPDGARMTMHGIHREIVPPSRISRTSIFEPAWYPDEAIETLTLTEEDGRTTANVTVRYDSRATRDSAIKSGMTDGMPHCYTVLDRVLTEGESALLGT